MAKKIEEKVEVGTEITTVSPQSGLILSGTVANMPAFLSRDTNAGKEGLGEYVSPPRVKVTQSNRTSQYKDFPEGCALLVPTNVILAMNDQRFWFVPLLFFPEYTIQNPIAMKGQLPMIRERTFDPRSEIAVIARDPDRRKSMPCPENPKEMLSYVEYMTFICVIVNNEQFAGLPVTLSFSSTEFKVGQQLATYITMRRQAPLYACVFEAWVPKQKRSNTKGEWYGLNVSNPSSPDAPSQWVQDEAEYEALKAQHESLKRAHQEKLVIVDYEDDVNELNGAPAVPSEAAATM